MTVFDDEVSALGDQINRLPRQRAAAFYLAAGTALLPGYRAAEGTGNDHLIIRAIETARAYALRGEVAGDAGALVAEMEATDLDEEALEATLAQDCWICLDVSVRLMVEPDEPGDGAWYVLEPLMQATSERLFGYTDVGSVQENELTPFLVADPRMSAALRSCRSAVDLLATASALDDAVLNQLNHMLSAIAP